MSNNGIDENHLVTVNNIPSSFRSADLRRFFSQFIEEGAFRCFHYKHRPQTNPNGESVLP